MNRDRSRGGRGAHVQDRPSTGYIYLVKNPASNETSICAWDSVLYPGTSVVAPTRYGLDLGVVITNADRLGGEYLGGDDQVRGCCFHAQPWDEQEEEEELELSDEIIYNDQPDEHQCSACKGCLPTVEPKIVELAGDVDWIDRLATPSDLARSQELLLQEDEAMRICREKIAERKLEMKLVTTHFLLGEPKIIF
ncbi:MAG: PSP1 domain-containing protein, partial [Sphaerochaeta sp.]